MFIYQTREDCVLVGGGAELTAVYHHRQGHITSTYLGGLWLSVLYHGARMRRDDGLFSVFVDDSHTRMEC